MFCLHKSQQNNMWQDSMTTSTIIAKLLGWTWHYMTFPIADIAYTNTRSKQQSVQLQIRTLIAYTIHKRRECSFCSKQKYCMILQSKRGMIYIYKLSSYWMHCRVHNLLWKDEGEAEVTAVLIQLMIHLQSCLRTYLMNF
jgi:hypothetical protein